MQIKIVQNKPKSEVKCDIISHLPEEISEMIFRMLDAKSVISSRLVSRKWLKRVNVDRKNSLKNLKKKLLEEVQEDVMKNLPELKEKLKNVQLRKRVESQRKSEFKNVRNNNSKKPKPAAPRKPIRIQRIR